ncbi:MAG TPA: M48 family metallopeptidase [Noviherbaspirillum sp.]|nr:M48 family metallopeptidase [Noviherbaspirillum sp.]
MNFFEQQDHARRQTRTLIFLFGLAVIAIVAAVNGAMAFIWSWTQSGYVLGMRAYPKGFFATNTLITLALIGVGTLIEMFNLRDGGDAVAKMAGGRHVSPSTTDLRERRLLNVVEEMALAAGIACPKVYLLDREDAINAFAAGYNPDQAVVAVTRGTLSRLTRDELQGVIAHEFSHILNGDMRLNVRLIGLLFGIQMIAGFGRHLMDFGSHTWDARERSDKKPSVRGVLFLSGIALLAVGYIGVFFGRLIKAAVSRQREFLADASALQFTRNADGIGGALRKIGGLSRPRQPGSRIAHPNAEHLSHLFLGAPRQRLVSGLLATHPSIEERLRRIFGRDVDMLDAREVALDDAVPKETLPDIPWEASGFSAQGTVAPWLASKKMEVHATALPPELDSAVREPRAASAVVYALLLGCDAERDAQLAILQQATPDLAVLVPYLASAITRLPKSARLPLLDLAMPALKQLSESERTAVLMMVDKLISADNRRTLAEFVLETVLARRLAMHAGRATPAKYSSLGAVRADCIVLLSLVAHVASPARPAIASKLFAAGAARIAELGLSCDDLMPVVEIDYARVRMALDRTHRLMPLAKPMLIKALLATTGEAMSMPQATADLLRALCAALEAPVPPVVAETYTNHYW